MRDDYEVVIGLEVHAELSTNTKIYCNCSTEFGADPNTHCCPICTGMPGVLPVLNKKVVEYAVKAGLATNCEISRFSKQDRKNYFYPDLPKAFQTSQYDLPLCEHGYLEFNVDGYKKKVGITRIHIEEDAGKLIHDAYTGATLVDMNRCAVPLIEIVSEPDIRTADEAVMYMQTLKSILEYLEVCDCKMQEGSLRCDVNLSVRKKGSTEFGTRTETKNLNSFKSIKDSIEFETKRQIEELENGGVIYQETRRFDEETGTTIRMRTKADAIDYKYFVEPNIPKFKIDSNLVEEIKKCIPVLPNERKIKYINEYGLSEYDANIIIKNKEYADYFEECVSLGMDKKIVANYLIVQIIAYLNKEAISLNEFYLKPNLLNQIISELEKGNISSKQAKDIFNKALEEEKEPKNFISKDNAQISDSNELTIIIDNILKNNTSQVEAYKGGKTNLFDYFVGQVMKETRGKANPSLTKEILKDKLDN